jgi:hypothetical protein
LVDRAIVAEEVAAVKVHRVLKVLKVLKAEMVNQQILELLVK